MILKHKAELAGRVKLQISGGERGTIDYPWQDNMILDQGFVFLLTMGGGNTSGLFQEVFTGSSSQPVSSTDVSLISPLASWRRSKISHRYDNTLSCGVTIIEAVSARGQSAGNVSELGIGSINYQSAGTRLISRTLVKDINGDPATITVLPDEVLTVTWEFRRWWVSPSNHVLTYTIDGVEHVTTVSYLPEQDMDKTQWGLSGAGTDGGFNGSLITGFSAQKTQVFSETEGNPSISSLTTPVGRSKSEIFPYQYGFATFTPPIPKTNEFVCEIVWELTLARRVP